MYICRALLDHGYSAFSLAIIEYIDVTGLSKADSKELILEREQHYINSLSPKYNINPIAGSRLGSQHTDETKALIGEAKRGQIHPRGMQGKAHSDETKTRISEAMTGIAKTEETKVKMSIAKGGGSIFVYDKNGLLVKSFSSASEAAKSHG